MDFTIYRFLVGLGVGGMFGAATTLVAESVPGQFRAVALGSLQALSALGNIIGSLVSLRFRPGAQNFVGGYSGWRVLFFVGILPSLLIVPIMFVLKEPDSWLTRRGGGRGRRGADKSIGSPLELFRASALAPQHHRRPVPRRVRHDRPVGHRLLLAGADLDRAQGRAAGRRRHACAAWARRSRTSARSSGW